MTDLDPRIRAELARRGPANVRALLIGLGGGVARNTPVPLQLPARVPVPLRGDVEDWLREKEQEAERDRHDTLKWAKIAGWAAIIGVIVGIAAIVVTLRTSGH